VVVVDGDSAAAGISDVKTSDDAGNGASTSGVAPMNETEIKMRDFVSHYWTFKGIRLQRVRTSPTCTVTMMLDMVKQSRLFVPDTVELWFGGVKLAATDKRLIGDLGMKADDELEIRGIACPLSKDVDFLQNVL
jgi:hypothetical protein